MLSMDIDQIMFVNLYKQRSNRKMLNQIKIMIIDKNLLWSHNQHQVVNSACLWLRSTAKESWWVAIPLAPWMWWWATDVLSKIQSLTKLKSMTSANHVTGTDQIALHNPRAKDKSSSVKSTWTRKSWKLCNIITYLSSLWTIWDIIQRMDAAPTLLTMSQFKLQIRPMANNSNLVAEFHHQKMMVSQYSLLITKKMCRGQITIWIELQSGIREKSD